MKQSDIVSAAEKIAEGLGDILDLIPWIVGFLALAIIGNIAWFIWWLVT